MAKETRSSNLAAGSNVKMREATSRSRTKQRGRISTASGDIAVGFINFVKNHSVVSLAVGFVIATQAQTVIKQLVSSFITPTFQFFFSGSLVKDAVHFHINGRTVSYTWGAFVNEMLNLIFILLTLYLIVRFFKLDKLNKES